MNRIETYCLIAARKSKGENSEQLMQSHTGLNNKQAALFLQRR